MVFLNLYIIDIKVDHLDLNVVKDHKNILGKEMKIDTEIELRLTEIRGLEFEEQSKKQN